jgi:hypothetical protein
MIGGNGYGAVSFELSDSVLGVLEKAKKVLVGTNCHIIAFVGTAFGHGAGFCGGSFYLYSLLMNFPDNGEWDSYDDIHSWH